MKKILFFACVISLLTSTGCFFPGPGRGGDRWHDHRAEINVTPPIIEARAPEVIVAPPAVEVRAPEIDDE
jgi:hypothetical protein